MKHTYLILSLFLVLISCADQENEDIGATTYEVDPVFEPYVQEFIQEGAKRGTNIDFSDTGLKVEFSGTALESANGLCYLGRHHIIINKENWFRFSEGFRSYLLFHELGHCELDRRHRNDQFEDGEWKSIMKGDPFTGIQNRTPTPYFGFRKDYYIAELFDSTIPDPEWSKKKYDYHKSFDRKNIIQQTALPRINERPSTIPKNYEFEIDFQLVTANNIRTKLEWGTTTQSYYVYIIPGWGYYIGVRIDNLNNDLHYSNNITLFNGKPIEKITVRRQDGVEQLFINEVFVFHLDALPELDFMTLEAKGPDGNLASDFEAKSFVFNELN